MSSGSAAFASISGEVACSCCAEPIPGSCAGDIPIAAPPGAAGAAACVGSGVADGEAEPRAKYPTAIPMTKRDHRQCIGLHGGETGVVLLLWFAQFET